MTTPTDPPARETPPLRVEHEPHCATCSWRRIVLVRGDKRVDLGKRWPDEADAFVAEIRAVLAGP